MRTGGSARARVAAAGGAGCGRGTRGGVVPRLEDGRGSAGPESFIYSGSALPVVVAVRRCVVDDGEAGMPNKAETDTVEPLVAEGADSCVELRNR